MNGDKIFPNCDRLSIETAILKNVTKYGYKGWLILSASFRAVAFKLSELIRFALSHPNFSYFLFAPDSQLTLSTATVFFELNLRLPSFDYTVYTLRPTRQREENVGHELYGYSAHALITKKPALLNNYFLTL